MEERDGGEVSDGVAFRKRIDSKSLEKIGEALEGE